MKPHKHAALIKAWADGAVIQLSLGADLWEDKDSPGFKENLEYRIKPSIPDKVNVGGKMVAAPIQLTNLVVSRYYWTITAGGSVDSVYCVTANHMRHYANNSNLFSTLPDALEWHKAWHELKQAAIDGKVVCILPDTVIPTQDSDGWIKWEGGECPVPLDTLVLWTIEGWKRDSLPTKAGSLCWGHTGGRGDIVEYKVVT